MLYSRWVWLPYLWAWLTNTPISLRSGFSGETLVTLGNTNHWHQMNKNWKMQEVAFTALVRGRLICDFKFLQPKGEMIRLTVKVKWKYTVKLLSKLYVETNLSSFAASFTSWFNLLISKLSDSDNVTVNFFTTCLTIWKLVSCHIWPISSKISVWRHFLLLLG